MHERELRVHAFYAALQHHQNYSVDLARVTRTANEIYAYYMQQGGPGERSYSR